MLVLGQAGQAQEDALRINKTWSSRWIFDWLEYRGTMSHINLKLIIRPAHIGEPPPQILIFAQFIWFWKKILYIPDYPEWMFSRVNSVCVLRVLVVSGWVRPGQAVLLPLPQIQLVLLPWLGLTSAKVTDCVGVTAACWLQWLSTQHTWLLSPHQISNCRGSTYDDQNIYSPKLRHFWSTSLLKIQELGLLLVVGGSGHWLTSYKAVAGWFQRWCDEVWSASRGW